LKTTELPKFSVPHLTRKFFKNSVTEEDSIFIGLIRRALLCSVCSVKGIVKTENLHGNLPFNPYPANVENRVNS